MRILHLIPNLIHGGAQRQLSYLAPELARLGHEIHVAYSEGGPNLARLEVSNIVLHPLHSRNNYDPSVLAQLLRLVLRVRPDIIQTWIVQMDILGGIVARMTQTPW